VGFKLRFGKMRFVGLTNLAYSIFILFMSFDFDSPDSVQKTKVTPSIKALNEEAGFFIAEDNLGLVQWKDRKYGGAYRQKTEKTGQDGRPIYIDGIVIHKPKMLILDESPLLVRSRNKPRRFVGLYDTNSYDAATQQAYRIYQVVLLDAFGNALHKETLQLTACGHFGVNFNNELSKFREECIQQYCISKGIENDNTKRVTRWHSFWIFAPNFKPEKKGQSVQSFACITKDFVHPDAQNLSAVNIAMNPEHSDFTKEIAELQSAVQESWLLRVQKSQDSID
jgi:Family of unknown function (DUF5895)